MADVNSMQGKRAIVTGGGTGLGAATAMGLARRGVNVCINYNSSADAANEVVAQCKALGVEAFAMKANVGEDGDCRALVAATVEKFGGVDVLVNNAGITQPLKIMDISHENYDAVMDVNLLGTLNMSQSVIPHMRERKTGKLINMSSVSAQRGGGIFGGPHYSAAKAGVIGLTRSSAAEFASRGVTVNAVAPGFIETDMTSVLKEEQRAALLTQIPLAGFGRGEDIAEAVLYLAGPGGRYVTGQVLVVDGGMVM